jgi:hypothetical protein
MKSPKWYFTIDNKAFQKNTIKVINFALKLKDKFELTDEEFDICISAIFLADTCYYSDTNEIWKEKDIIEDHPTYVRKYYIKKCPIETAHLNTIGVFDKICTCILNHENKNNINKLDKLSLFVNISFYLSTLSENKEIESISLENLITPEIQLFL